MSKNLHEQIRLKLSAFFFNNKADALRGEMYRALILSALSDIPKELNFEGITSRVALYLGLPPENSPSLKAILSSEIHSLVERGEVIREKEIYKIPESERLSAPGEESQSLLLQSVYREIEQIGKSIKPNISKHQIDNLFDFYIEAVNLIANYQVPHLARGASTIRFDKEDLGLQTAVSECRTHHDIDSFIDGEEFISATLLHPTGDLLSFAYHVLQVAVSIQLLAWDPSLEYLQNKIFSNKTLYLDTNILFPLMLESSPFSSFCKNLLKASKDDLGIDLVVHERTLTEYSNVIDYHNLNFASQKRVLTELAGFEPGQLKRYLQSSIFVDYILKNPKHIDEGTWSRHINSISLNSLKKTLSDFRIRIDRSSLFVPEPVFTQIKMAMLEASTASTRERRGREKKSDVDHDSRIFHLVESKRKKSDRDGLSLTFDRYLLTFDGSLVEFIREYGISATQTYFVFPKQWYEITFPFFRIKYSNKHEFERAVINMAFSQAFPQLAALIPLELCGYVFDSGGRGLEPRSIKAIVEEGLEELITVNVNPDNRDAKDLREAELKVQTLIAKMKLKEEGNEAATNFEAERLRLEKENTEITKEKERLEQSIRSEKDLHEEVTTRLKTELAEKKEELAGLNASLVQLNIKVEELVNQKLREVEEKQQQELAAEEERRASEENRQKKKLQTRILVTALLMSAGLILNLILCLALSQSIVYTVITTVIFLLGIVLYSRSPKTTTLLIYGAILFISAGRVISLLNMDYLFFSIPAFYELLLIVIDRTLKN